MTNTSDDNKINIWKLPDEVYSGIHRNPLKRKEKEGANSKKLNITISLKTFSQSAPEMNTFQCVYVTDGQLAYAITTYKVGEMNWLYSRWRYIDIGFTSPSKTLDFGYRRTDLTTKLTTNTFNTGTVYCFRVVIFLFTVSIKE